MDVGQINNCVSYHMRNEEMAYNNLKNDMIKFEEYANFGF